MTSYKRPLEGVEKWTECAITGKPCPKAVPCDGCIVPTLEEGRQ